MELTQCGNLPSLPLLTATMGVGDVFLIMCLFRLHSACFGDPDGGLFASAGSANSISQGEGWALS